MKMGLAISLSKLRAYVTMTDPVLVEHFQSVEKKKKSHTEVPMLSIDNVQGILVQKGIGR